MDTRIIIRAACYEDLPALCELENKVWKDTGVPVIDPQTLGSWLHAHPEGFLVAIDGSKVCGYVFVEAIDFDPRDMTRGAFADIVRLGHIQMHHRPDGNAFYGVSIATDRPGSGIGKLLLEQVIVLARRTRRRHIVTFARMPGFSAFLERYSGRFSDVSREALACHYARRSILCAGGTCAARVMDPMPDALSDFAPDAVLSFFTRALGMSLHGITHTPEPDPPSAHMAAIMVRTL